MAAPLKPRDELWRAAWTAGIVLAVALVVNDFVVAQNPDPVSSTGASLRFLEISSPEVPPPLPPISGQTSDSQMKASADLVPVIDREEPDAGIAENSSDTEFNSWNPAEAGGDILQLKCSSCGSRPVGLPTYPNSTVDPMPAPSPTGQKNLRDTLFWGCSNCGVGKCVPGRHECYPCCHTDTAVGRFVCNLYHCICCPDPCYEGKWMPIADSSFFVESARPVSHTRLRWDAGVNLILPDRSEYFWARADGLGRGPRPVAPALVVPRLRYHELHMYTEIATGPAGFGVDIPYRSVDPDFAPHAAGFSDMSLTPKTLIFDCELLQVAIQMRTYLPVGNSMKGLGVGHVSLEPSLIFGIKLHPDAYLQGQIAEWIPLGGDPAYAGSILHYHFGLNQVLCRCLPDVPLIGTLEFSGYSFQDGAYTDPVFGPYQQSSNATYFYLGTGLRLFVCDRIDFGFGVNLALSDTHFADQLYRSEFRFRY